MDADRCDPLCLDLEKAERLRAKRIGAEQRQALANEYKALGDPTRLMLALARSHHLRAHRSQQLVRSRRDGKMALYSLTEHGSDLLSLARSADSVGSGA